MTGCDPPKPVRIPLGLHFEWPVSIMSRIDH
jgi:hypothetical protein